MQDGGNLAIERARFQRGAEVLLVEVVSNFAIHQIAEFFALAQVVDREDIGLAARIQRPDQVGSDKSGSAGNDDLHIGLQVKSSSGCTTAVPSLPTTIPAAWFASRNASAKVAPAANMTPRMAITVSPAPLTSYTSRATAGTCKRSPSRYRVMPSSLRVTSSASTPSSARSLYARSVRSSSLFQRPATSRNSDRFGVINVAPL